MADDEDDFGPVGSFIAGVIAFVVSVMVFAAAEVGVRWAFSPFTGEGGEPDWGRAFGVAIATVTAAAVAKIWTSRRRKS